MPSPSHAHVQGQQRGDLLQQDGSAVAIGRELIRDSKLRGVEHATWLHTIAIQARALLIVFVLVQAFRANPRTIRRRTIQWVGHHGGL
jgi:hypothetical protein